MHNDQVAAPLPSETRSRVEVSPTGRLLSAGIAPGLLFQYPPLRPAQGKVRLLQHGERVISLEMDFSQIEARVIASLPKATAQYLKRR